MAWQLAVVNIATILYETDDLRMAGFMDNLDEVNELAERSPGFVYRYQTEAGNATDERIFDDPQMLLNLSVWEDLESIKAYTYKTEHVDFLRRRREWFTPAEGWPVIACWWIPEGHVPGPEEAKERLEHLRDNGPTDKAFTFREVFAPPT